ncbi:MAG: AAA family ATPase [Muribaculaceae bacterium]|nr:AAA family ATPase [Muribaculaceae bacterium]
MPTHKHPDITEQLRLLRIEYEEERRAFSRLTGSIGVERLTARGNAWFPIRKGKDFHNSLNQRVVEIYRCIPEGADTDASDDDDDHNFEYGRPVSFFTMEGSGADTVAHRFSGTVSYVDADRMVVAIPENADLSLIDGEGRCGVMLSFDETSYRAMTEALQRLMKADGRLGYLRDLFYSHRKAAERGASPIRIDYLNGAQEAGVNKILRAKDVAILHGPPGTGKTTTLVEAIHETLRRESQVLVCAQSNMAVDWIAEKLQDRGIAVLRIGNPTRVTDKMLASTYERRFESHPDYTTLWSLRKAIRQLRSERRSSPQWHQKMDRLQSRATELEIRINADLFGEARVIACTLVGSSSRLFDGMKFSTLFIDEAAQALEAACWIPMRRAGRVILAGDHCQLPPTVKSVEAMRGGLAYSLMERIAADHPEAVTLLTTQYRMHEDIMRVPNRWFYHGRIKAAPEVRWRSILDLDTPIEWIDTSEMTAASPTSGRDNGHAAAPDSRAESRDTTDASSDSAFREALTGQSFGRINRDEGLLTLLTLGEYFIRSGRRRILEERVDVGIISPYRAQVQYLRSLIRRVPFFKPFRHLISVNTVDGFQGQERDVIVVSLVRSNEEGDIGFLRDLRRMNVAITRARMKLLIIGNADTMRRHRFYRRLHDYTLSLRNRNVTSSPLIADNMPPHEGDADTDANQSTAPSVI